MGVIEEVYEDLETDVSFEDFEAAVREKVEQMGGLADEETAAMLIAHELADEEVNSIADIEPGMDEVKFIAKVVSVGELRTFERDGDDEDGRVVNVEVADESDHVRITFWDDMAGAIADGELEVGDVIRVKGRPKDGYNGVEVNVDRAEVDEDAEVDVSVQDAYRIEDLSLGLSDVNLKGKVLDTEPIRTFDRDDGTEGRVANLVLGDPTGRVRVTLWDDQASLTEEFSPGESVEVIDGYVRERDGDLELHVGSRGTVEPLDEPVEYVPDTADIAGVEIGETVDITGGVIEAGSKRTFDRDDGSTGQVRNIRVKDETGDIRVALWGEKADAEVDLADRVVLTDVEIQDGWQDDLEASAGWRSTISVLDEEADVDVEPADSAAAGSESDARDEQSQGLDAFSDARDGTASSDGDAASAESADGASSGAVSTVSADGEEIEFTGTVVQAGSPVVLDDGDETWSVETDADLRLGEKVTVRGRVRDDRIHADDVL